MIVSTHQPHYIPWIGYLHKISKSDTFVILDNVQYTKNSYINRNSIRHKEGTILLTVPVKYKGASKYIIKDIEIDKSSGFKGLHKHLKTLTMNYNSGVGFDEFFPIIEHLYSKEYKWIFDLDHQLLLAILEYLKIDTEIVISSEENIHGAKEDELFLSMLEKTKSDTLLLGLGASMKYVNTESVTEKGYKITYQKFVHPVYKQRNFSDFINGISIVDMLFNNSQSEAIEIIKNCSS
ncbi:MAG: WbqC family protein [Colwellia sp.]|nr:WbqC family protein [Colwellia sp.]